jgi:hypothetical protein
LVVSEAVKHARIEIIGGESQFFDRITGAISGGKAVERLLENSNTLRDIKDTFFNGDPDHFKSQLKNFIDRFGMSSDDLKNLTISAALARMMSDADDGTKSVLGSLLSQAKRMGLADTLAATVAGTDGVPVRR